MRSLKEERGAVAVVTAVLMAFVLIGCAALAIDVSSLYQERRSLQNGSDSAALAVAKDCAEPTGCGAFTDKANSYADLNADDGNHNIDLVCGTGAGLSACPSDPSESLEEYENYVKVVTSSNDPSSPGNPNEVNFVFAPVLDLVKPGADYGGRTVRASTVVAWGSPGAATTLPLTFSQCEFDELVPDPESLQTVPPFTGTPSIISFHEKISKNDENPCGIETPGHDFPGGFGWLRPDPDSDCQTAITVEDWVDVKPGNNSPCVDFTPLRNKTVLIPIYDIVNGKTGNNAEYHIVGFAAFHITGYRFPGNNWPSSGPKKFDCSPTPGQSNTCLRGFFVGFTTTGTGFGGPDMGVTIFKIVG